MAKHSARREPRRRHGRLVGVVIVALAQFPALAAAQANAATFVDYPVLTANAQPFGIAAGPDGNVWFTEYAAGSIGKITPAGVVTEYPLSISAARPYGITAGSDGNMWLTEFDQTYGNRIGRITRAGVITEYTLPTANAQPVGIAAGPDGKVWFAENGANKIGKIDPKTATITEYPVKTAGSGPLGIAAGPDGKVWFTENYADRIGRVAPATGAMTEYSTPTAGSGPDAIAAGPDGKTWLTEYGGSSVAKATPFSITEYPTPTAGSVPVGLCVGSNGKVWFTENALNALAMSSAAGSITEYPIATSGTSPRFIATGPDGRVWFTEFLTNAIGAYDIRAVKSGYGVVLDGAYAVAKPKLPFGTTMRWTFAGGRSHSVTDQTGLGLYDSTALPPGSGFSFKFSAAGTYTYSDSLSGFSGSVAIMLSTKSNGDGRYAVTWAAQTAPSGLVYDVQLKRPGETSFTDWMTSQTSAGATFSPDAGPGTYTFRARLSNPTAGTSTGYSPNATIKA